MAGGGKTCPGVSKRGPGFELTALFFISQANVEGWIPSATDPFGGRGSLGACCSEMSLW